MHSVCQKLRLELQECAYRMKFMGHYYKFSSLTRSFGSSNSMGDGRLEFHSKFPQRAYLPTTNSLKEPLVTGAHALTFWERCKSTFPIEVAKTSATGCI